MEYFLHHRKNVGIFVSEIYFFTWVVFDVKEAWFNERVTGNFSVIRAADHLSTLTQTHHYRLRQ